MDMKKTYVAAIYLMILAFIPSALFAQEVIKPSKILKPVYFDKSKPLRDIEPITPAMRGMNYKNKTVKNNFNIFEEFTEGEQWTGPDPVLQDETKASRASDPTMIQNFPGLDNIAGYAPPDTDGDVGLNHYLQMTNVHFAIWDKEGSMVYGPAQNITLWDGFDGPWSNTNDGDPIVLYDEYADRWLTSQFALVSSSGPFYMLIAVSETGDPTGAWYRYAYQYTHMPDYPKIGVWGNSYTITINQFANSSSWVGGGVSVTDRQAMLEGDPDAEMMFFHMGANYGSLQPADADGTLAPPDGTDQPIMNLGNNSLRLWNAQIDWDNPDDSKIQIKDILTTEPFSVNNMSVNQPGTSQKLATMTGRMMFRLQYRNFDEYEAMVCYHDVNADGFGQAGLRWYELRRVEGEDWEIYQQGTFAPDDDDNRWMGSIAMNQNGDIAIGYSVSGTDTYPSIRFAGQTTGAPEGLGILDIAETSVLEGNASQTGVNRWGDYSKMVVDPSDGQTFWYTNEYSHGGWNWDTQIAAFGFAQPPVAEFDANEVIVPVGEDVNFTDLTSGIPNTWEWSFDGGDPATSSDQNPEGIFYNTEGIYSVQLISSNDLGEDTIVKSEYITASSTILPDVEFMADEDFVCVGAQVNFSDMTQYSPIQWLWEFEPETILFVDGSDETSQNPMVIFTEAAEYTVTLTSWNLNGESMLTKEDYVIAGGYSPYFMETFDGSNLKANNWTIENPDNDVTWEQYETGGTEPGNLSAGVNFKEYFVIGQRDRLITPQLNLEGMSSAVLEFQHSYAQFVDGFSDSLIVYVASDCSEEWTRVYTGGEDGEGSFATHEIADEFWPTVASDWCMEGWGASCINIDLSPWIGKSGVRIAFETYSNYGNPIMIDNVIISQYVGQEELAVADEELLMIYPNPTTGTFNVVLPDGQSLTDLQLINHIGQLVYSQNLSETDKTLVITPNSDWAPGIYFLRVTGNGNGITKKVILK